MADFENLKLENQLCFALYAATNAITRTYRGKLKEVGLTYPQYLVMMVLWENEGIPIKTIAARLQLDPATVTPLVQRLEEASLVMKVRDTGDDRIVNVYLRDEGKQIQSQVAAMQQSVACETGLTESQFVELRSSLHKLVETLNQGLSASDQAAA